MYKKTFSNFSEETSLIIYWGYYYCLRYNIIWLQ